MFNDVWKDNTAWSADNGTKGNYREVQPLNSRDLYFSNWEMNEFRVPTIVLAVFLSFVLVALVAVIVSVLVCPKIFGLAKAGQVSAVN